MSTGTSGRARAVVVGGGVYGWGCALRLSELGASVTVVDPRAVGDEQRASGGVTRVLRLEYGAQAHYGELTLRARSRWREIEAATGTDLYREVGVLFLVPEGDDGAWERRSLEATRALGAAGEDLDAAAITRRWPAVRPAGLVWGVFNPTGGFLWANRATAAIAGLAAAAGVAHVPDRATATDGGGVNLASGGRIDADVVVLATGAGRHPWCRTPRSSRRGR
jgi:glycine/D-amino acid oxidase-like deaminating enzyme